MHWHTTTVLHLAFLQPSQIHTTSLQSPQMLALLSPVTLALYHVAVNGRARFGSTALWQRYGTPLYDALSAKRVWVGWYSVYKCKVWGQSTWDAVYGDVHLRVCIRFRMYTLLHVYIVLYVYIHVYYNEFSLYQPLFTHTQTSAMQMCANSEIMLGFVMVLGILRGISGMMLAYMWWTQLKIRYHAPDFMQQHRQVCGVHCGCCVCNHLCCVCSRVVV